MRGLEGASKATEVVSVKTPSGPKNPTILVVDDDPDVRLLLRECLELEGFHVLEARDGAELRRTFASSTVDLVTLDLNLGGEDGLALAREIRADRNVPIVMISGKSDTIDRVVGLELGADDYITKPFHLREVLARVRAVLRRYETNAVSSGTRQADKELSSASSATFAFDGWILDIDRRELRRDPNGNVQLTTAEFNLLEIFVQRPARVLSRDDIMDLLKGHDWSPLDRSIDSLIARLRKKIERDCDEPRLIKTVRGVGYAFSESVRKH
ncbi:MAG: DNA-binding response regulator [Hyphomicrobium sp.]|nr:DNA-binding response regulator [Hyphomicrobium sp.]PPC83623.1 MAG: DNA-binding response regulator [Hyphomicrobium sp.]